MSEEKGGKLVQETVEVTDVHSNLSQEVIKITTDKLKLILKDYLVSMEKKKEWIAPLGIVLTLLVVLITTTFQKAYFSADTWKAIFIILLVLSIAWLIKSGWGAYKSPSVEDIVQKIKSGD
ncbi:hypothetical protein J8L73_02945 [Pseudoalteromonas sp. MMG006]|uniref:hypothetical protein n=1 Tax=Pseudoalteromonas sp. MMG006 TaxID=2822683 RepID=UPI001B3909D2|nr:hypothetical protein [Pseudoalteromonas sp. MMG006]MBQ4798105.1 hypothetical protein [Pseudoalteromonas sp. MMG006]